MTSISVCIATHDRPRLLAATLEGLARQTRIPDEIVVSDSSSPTGEDVVGAFASSHPNLPVKHVASSRKALPWQRWWAFDHSHGDVILFLDDDVVLSPPALQTLERTYLGLAADSSRAVAGVGFRLVYDDGTELLRDPTSFRERWLRLTPLPAGSLTPGGLTVSIAGLQSRDPVEVDVLWGGAMSFRREALARLPLDNLVSLYEAGIGRGEDAVLSRYARRSGKLYVLTEPFAVHPAAETDAATPYAKDGWRLGLTHTLGRAHTMRWMAEDWSSYKRDWWRSVSLELARGAAAILRRPWQGRHWLRLVGACYGILCSLRRWNDIPRAAN